MARTAKQNGGEPADVLTIFGITGDLAKKMTFHALYRLEARGKLDCPIVGVAIDEWSVDRLREHAREAIAATVEDPDGDVFGRLAARFSYVQGDYAGAGDELLVIVEEMAAAADVEEGSEADIRFHECLVELAGSPRLSRMHQTYLVETRMCVHALADTYENPTDRVAEHQALASAIRAGDVQLSDKLLIAHMEDAVDRLTERLSRSV